MKSKKLAVLFSVYFLTNYLNGVITAPANADEQDINSELLQAATRLNKLMAEDKTNAVQNRHVNQNTNIAEDDTNDGQSNDQHEVDEFKNSLREFQSALLKTGMRKALMHQLFQMDTAEDLGRLKRSNRRKMNRVKRRGFWWRCPFCNTAKAIGQAPCCDKSKDDNKPSPSL